jgi:hypothetical protein
MIEITYDPEHGTPVADGKVAVLVDSLVAVYKQSNNVRRTFATETVIHEFRIRVAKGEVAHTDIVFKYQDQELFVERDGCLPLSSWPVGCADFMERKALELLRLVVPIGADGKKVVR